MTPARPPALSDAMPTTRGLNFFLEDRLRGLRAGAAAPGGARRGGGRRAGCARRAGRQALIADEVRGTLAEVQARVAAWPRLPASDAEVEARPVAEALYHVLAGSLLLEHGQALVMERGDYRTLLVAVLYVRKYLRPPAPPASLLPPRALDQLGALIDWTLVPADALAGELLGHP